MVNPKGITKKFQSTHSLRSATLALFPEGKGHNVSIHALLAECDTKNMDIVTIDSVSIHALLAECDFCCLFFGVLLMVSIHALLAECDCA